MQQTVTVYLYGQAFQVPSELTVMQAMEYAGYQLKHGCSCRNGVCGACAAVYRIEGDGRLRTGLACQTKVVEGLHVLAFPSRPVSLPRYDIRRLHAHGQQLRRLYPELDVCVGCNACTRACPQGVDVRQVVAYARRGEYAACVAAADACVMCGLCSSRCPVEIDPPRVAMLARRLSGRYLAPACEHLDRRLQELENGELTEELAALTVLPADRIKELYDHRDFED